MTLTEIAALTVQLLGSTTAILFNPVKSHGLAYCASFTYLHLPPGN